ncbi:MAG: hypothetical protein ACRCW1_08360, partial [Anaerotignaceae bacterium]
MDIWDVALLKCCVASMGILIGMQISKNHKKNVEVVAIFTFIATYIPLMAKLINVMYKKSQTSYLDEDYDFSTEYSEV